MSGSLDHDQAFELLPWLINGTLQSREREAVERHVRDCLICRAALREQQHLRTLVQEQPAVPLSAEQGFEQLARQLDRPPRAHAAKRSSGGLGLLRRTGLAIAATVAVAAIGALAAVALDSARERSGYTTLTEGAEADGPHVDIIFAKWVTESDMRTLLNDVDATIVGGPSALGRYTIRLGTPGLTDGEIVALIERLGRDRRVSFAGRSFVAAEPVR